MSREKDTGTLTGIDVWLAFPSVWLAFPGVFLQPRTMFWKTKPREFVVALLPEDALALRTQGVRKSLSCIWPELGSPPYDVRFDTLRSAHKSLDAIGASSVLVRVFQC